MKPHFHHLNHTSAIVTFIELRTFNFLLVFFVSYVRISLLDEVNRISDTVDNQRRRGAKVAGLKSFDQKLDRCVNNLYQNNSYLHRPDLARCRSPRV